MRASANRGKVLIIVDPRLWSMEGHEFDHCLEVSRAAKRIELGLRVVVLTGEQDPSLKEFLSAESSIDSAKAVFPRRWLGDGSSAQDIMRAGLADSGVLAEALEGARVSLLFFPTLALYQLMMLAFLRTVRAHPGARAAGIFRNDPLDSTGQLRRKYRLLSGRSPLRALWAAATKRTAFYTDSPILQEVLADHLGIDAEMAPIPVPGVWSLNPGASEHSPAAKQTVGFIGQPRDSRGFPLFCMTALAMERERQTGALRFLAVIPPGSAEFWGGSRYEYIFVCGLPGMEIREALMTAQQFAGEMNKVDIVWAIGDDALYRRQTSGIFAHAVCLGKKVIFNDQSWAQRVLPSAASVKYVPTELRSVVSAINELAEVEEDPEFERIAGSWRRQHSREAFERFVAEVLDSPN